MKTNILISRMILSLPGTKKTIITIMLINLYSLIIVGGMLFHNNCVYAQNERLIDDQLTRYDSQQDEALTLRPAAHPTTLSARHDQSARPPRQVMHSSSTKDASSTEHKFCTTCHPTRRNTSDVCCSFCQCCEKPINVSPNQRRKKERATADVLSPRTHHAPEKTTPFASLFDSPFLDHHWFFGVPKQTHKTYHNVTRLDSTTQHPTNDKKDYLKTHMYEMIDGIVDNLEYSDEAYYTTHKTFAHNGHTYQIKIRFKSSPQKQSS